MVTILRILFSICMTAAFSLGQDEIRISDPELDFVQNSFLFKSVSQNKEIIRKEIDITGEGRMTIFLRSTVGGGKCGQYWTAYIKTSENSYQRYEDIEFREDTFQAGKVPIFNPEGGILAYYPGKGAGSLVQISFTSGKTNTKKIRTIEFSNPEDRLVFERIFGRKLEEPMPDEFFRNPSHKVISVAEILARPQASSRQKEPSESPDASAEVSEPEAKSQVPDEPFKSKQVQQRTERPLLKSWPFAASLAFAGACLLWLLLRKYAGAGSR